MSKCYHNQSRQNPLFFESYDDDDASFGGDMEYRCKFCGYIYRTNIFENPDDEFYTLMEKQEEGEIDESGSL